MRRQNREPLLDERVRRVPRETPGERVALAVARVGVAPRLVGVALRPAAEPPQRNRVEPALFLHEEDDVEGLEPPDRRVEVRLRDLAELHVPHDPAAVERPHQIIVEVAEVVVEEAGVRQSDVRDGPPLPVL